MEHSEKVKLAYQRLQETFVNLDVEGITILTGNNGSGKSLIRKQLPFAFKDLYELENLSETKGWIKSTSMDARTNSNPEFGALAGIMNDTTWVATSQNTLNSIEKLLDAVETTDKTKYVVIDEYEIGCSEETIVALAQYISERLQKLLKDGKIIGAMIITHSRIGCEHIQFDHFQNIEGKTYEEWKNREIVPTNLEELKANEMFLYIRDKKD
jgi:archaellum biogenesis ATPase FlaH